MRFIIDVTMDISHNIGYMACYYDTVKQGHIHLQNIIGVYIREIMVRRIRDQRYIICLKCRTKSCTAFLNFFFYKTMTVLGQKLLMFG